MPSPCSPSERDQRERLSSGALRASHGFRAPRRTPVTVARDSGTAMRALVLAILLVCLGLAGVGLARRLLIPLARAVQARCGYSDQFVTDLGIALPCGTFMLVILTGLIWLVA